MSSTDRSNHGKLIHPVSQTHGMYFIHPLWRVFFDTLAEDSLVPPVKSSRKMTITSSSLTWTAESPIVLVLPKKAGFVDDSHE